VQTSPRSRGGPHTAATASISIMKSGPYSFDTTSVTAGAAAASFDALDAIKAKPGRVCPLVSGHGFRADGDAWVKITCRAGYRVNHDTECEKVQDKKPLATREQSRARDDERSRLSHSLRNHRLKRADKWSVARPAVGRFVNDAGWKPTNKASTESRATGGVWRCGGL
jgi:hypothetical protein